MGRADTRKGSRKSKRKAIGFSILAIVVLLLAAGSYEYYQLQPSNHFKDVPVVGTAKASNDSSTENVPKPKSDTFNMLLLGSDERKGDSAGHTDSMLLVHVDLNTHQYQAISIPRDTRVHLDGYGYTKLTSVQYIIQSTKGKKQGMEAAAQSVSELTGVPINYYLETNYGGLQNMVDAMGTVNVNVPFDVKITYPWYPEDKNKMVSKGTQTLDGKMVTEMVHQRHSLQNGDYGRQQLQEAALAGIAKSALDPSNITHLPALINSVDEYLIGSNMSKSDMISLGLAAKGFKQSQVHYHQLHGTGKKMYDDILKANNDQIVLDPAEVKQITDKYFNS